MPEALHEKLLELQEELETLSSIRQQLEEHGTQSAAVISGAMDSMAKASTILSQIGRLTASIDDLVERTEHIDFPTWLKKLDEVLRSGLDAVSTELKSTSLAVTKTIQDEYSVLRADQKAAQERFQHKLEDIQKEITAHAETSAKNAKAAMGELSHQHNAINMLQQELMETREGLSKKISYVMVLVVLALLAAGTGVAVQFMQ